MGTILIAGIDTLEVGYEVEDWAIGLPTWDELACAKEAARSGYDHARQVELGGQAFDVLPATGRLYDYILRNGDIEVGIKRECGPDRRYPELHVKHHSAFLWREGLEGADRQVREWIGRIAHVSGEKISRADLCVDMDEALPQLSHAFQEVLTRAYRKGRYSEGDFSVESHVAGTRLTGYTFGRRGALQCRMYDKRAEILKSHKQWFYDLWSANGYEEGLPVTRVEFQVHRDILRSFRTRIDTVADLIEHRAALWDYLTDKWLSVREPSEDTNRSRWAVSRFWSVVHSAQYVLGEFESAISRIRQALPKMERLRTMARGALVSFGALLDAASGRSSNGEVGYDAIVQAVGEIVRDEGALRGGILQRRVKFAGMTA